MSKEMHEQDRDALHEAAMQNWRAMSKQALDNYNREKIHHSGEAARQLAMTTSKILPGVLQKCPYIIEQFYYAELWHASQHTVIGLLHKLEACIIKRLHRFIDGGSFDYWATDRELPVERHQYRRTNDEIKKNNVALANTRDAYLAAAATLPEYTAALKKTDCDIDVPLADVTALDDVQVFSAQPWSPTIGQCKAFAVHVQKLYGAPEPVQQIFHTLRPKFSDENVKSVKTSSETKL
jgi:hypothetical protein